MKNHKEIVTLINKVKLGYSSIYTFNKIITFTDLPYNFDQINKVWWRWYSDIYGFYYHRVKRSYSVWLTSYLKKNIGIYMPFFFRIPSKKSKILDNWRRCVFLYEKTLINKVTNILTSKYQNFGTIKYSQLSEAAKDILLIGNRKHRQINSFGLFGLELNMFISSYNARWNDLYKEESLFYNTGRMPTDFLIINNSFFISSGFFINSYDSKLLIYPQYYLEYYNKIFFKNFINLFSFFEIKNNIIFYYNILLLINKFFFKQISIKFINYVDLVLFNKYDFNIYKLNLYLYFMKYLKIYYNKFLNINFYFLLSMYINRYNFNKILLIKTKYDKYTWLNYIYYIFLNNTQNKVYNWISKEHLLKKNLYKYNFLYKFLNKFYLSKLDINEIKKDLYFKKLYITEWIYLWEILNNYTINFKNIKKKKQSLYFINKYSKIFKNKYSKIKDLYSIIKYLTNIKNKYNKNNLIDLKTNIMIKPSIKTFKKGLISKLTWVTHFGKHFVTIPYQYEGVKNTAFFFTNSFNKFRFLSYIKYTKFFLLKIKNFLLNFSSILVYNIKINFGFSYTLIGKPKLISVNNYFMYNIQIYIYIFFSFIKKYFKNKDDLLNIKKSYNLKNFNIFDKYFFFFLYFFPNRWKKINKKNFTSNYKGINIANFGYLKFINKF